MNDFVVAQVHRQRGLGHQFHRTVVRQIDLTHLSAILVKLNRQVSRAVELIGIRLFARVAEAETQVGRFTEIDSGICSELLHAEVVLCSLLDDNVIASDNNNSLSANDNSFITLSPPHREGDKDIIKFSFFLLYC